MYLKKASSIYDNCPRIAGINCFFLDTTPGSSAELSSTVVSNAFSITSLWPFGAILKDTFEKNEYFQYLNVENPDMLLEYVRQHENLPYKPIKLEDLMYVSDAAGIDNRWRGVSELGNLFIDKMGLNYYRATVLVRTLLIMIKNGSSYEKLQEKVSILSFENAQIREEVQQAVRQIFENVPVFEYKGYSRAEYKRLSYQKQLKKRKNLFTIIDGGKE